MSPYPAVDHFSVWTDEVTGHQHPPTESNRRVPLLGTIRNGISYRKLVTEPPSYYSREVVAVYLSPMRYIAERVQDIEVYSVAFAEYPRYE